MSTPNRVSTEADLNLFTSQIAWAGKQLHDNSLVQLVRWVSLQVHGRIVGDKDEREDSPLVDALLRMLQMESQLQKDAERKLIALMQHTLKTSVPRWKETETPTRHIDWPRTYQRALVQPPTRYQNRVTERVPDAQLMGALVYQARQWRDLLSRASQSYQQRCDALRRCCRCPHRSSCCASGSAHSSAHSPTGATRPNSTRCSPRHSTRFRAAA